MGILGAVLAGAAWIAAVPIELVPATSRGAVLVTYLFAWLGTLVGLLGLHAVQAPRQGWLGLTGFFGAFSGAGLALGGTVLTLAGTSGVFVREGSLDRALGLGFFIGLLGIVLFGVGFTLWGVAILQTRPMPLWCGVLIIVALLVASVLGISGRFGSSVVLGLLWIALGYALWRRRDE